MMKGHTSMPGSNSQEQNIYRNLAAQIQSGFYSDGKRFPSVQEIARQFHVSYCPAQRALKALESEGLISIHRGKETRVLKKPVDHFLEGDTFRKRIVSLIDLAKSLRLLSPAISFQGMCQMNPCKTPEGVPAGNTRIWHWRELYRTFEEELSALGNQTIHSLYQDINIFIESAFLDIFQMTHTNEEENALLNRFASDHRQCIEHCRNGRYSVARHQLQAMAAPFLDKVDDYLNSIPVDTTEQETFSWTPQKGRTRYCDMIAIDLVRKINEGHYPEGTFLPKGSVLANIYHVSPITMRRTIGLLNQLGVAKNVNGIGTRIVCADNTETSDRLKAMILGNNLRTFLEAYQLLIVTCEPVLRDSFVHFAQETREKLRQASTIADPRLALTTLTSYSLQGIVRYCPLASIQEIVSKLTLLLLNGSAVPFKDTGKAIDWPRESAMLADALKAGDGARYAFLFRRMHNDIFPVMKSHLQKIGVKNIDHLATPVFDDR